MVQQLIAINFPQSRPRGKILFGATACSQRGYVITIFFRSPPHDCIRADYSLQRHKYDLVKTGAPRTITNRSPSVALNRCGALNGGPTISCSHWTTGGDKNWMRKSAREHNTDELSKPADLKLKDES